MARFDTLLIDGGFAIGSTDYAEHYPNDRRNTRIVATASGRLSARGLIPCDKDRS